MSDSINPSRIRSTRLAWAGDLVLVGDHHDGAAGRGQRVEQVQHVLGAVAVQGAGGLVGQQQHRLGGDRPGDGHPLLLAAGQLGRRVAQPVAETDQLQRGLRPRPALPGPTPPYASGSSTLRSAVVRAIRLKLWKTKPILRFLIRDCCRSASRRTSMPSSR